MMNRDTLVMGASEEDEAEEIARFEKELGSAAFRLAHYYALKTEEAGRRVAFRPRPEQQEVIDALLERPEEPLYIIKARRLGISTAIGLTMADAAAWNSGLQCCLIDQTQADAQRKMAEIMRYGLLNLPPDLLAGLVFPKLNDSELQVRVRRLGEEEEEAEDKGEGEAEEMEGPAAISRIFAGRNARGGTNNFLWISEWGPMAAVDPKRSREIRTGALPSARRGRRVVETTWYGGKSGDLWELVKPLLERDPAAEGKVFFFPWHGDPACVKLTGTVDRDLEEYFRHLAERVGKTFTQEQKRWYASARLQQGIFIKREYPSTLEEAMSSPMEGTIYGDELTRLRAEGSMGPRKVDGSTLVHTFWDLGSPRATVTWYIQLVGDAIHVVDCDLSRPEQPLELTTTQRVAHILGKGYALGLHFLPHDAAATQKSGRSFAAELAAAGLANLKIVPRTQDVWVGINRLRQLLPRMTFRLPQCGAALELLQNYRTRPAGTMLGDEPVHDESSHAADALRTFAEAQMYGMISQHSAPRRERLVPEVVRRY